MAPTPEKIIDDVLPITVNVADRTYGMIGNITCVAAAVSSGRIMTKEHIRKF